jgi:hypothetical protein
MAAKRTTRTSRATTSPSSVPTTTASSPASIETQGA